MASYITNTASGQTQMGSQPKPGERLLQSAGYTHLCQIGSAADLPALGSSPVWRKVFQFQETVGTVSDYLFKKTGKTGTTKEDVSDLIDTKDPTKLAYLGIQQLLAGRIPEDVEMLTNLLSGLGKPLDDRKLLLEDVVALLASAGRSRHHGPNSTINGLQGQFINLLWNDLPHPPTVTLAPEHRYRSADGSYNNLTGFPMLGAAKQPYARSVRPIHAHAPDVAEPEDFFDAILRRKPGPHGFKPHPAGISSLFFAFANLIIHDLFWTNNAADPDSPMDNKPNDDHTKPAQEKEKSAEDVPPKKRGRSQQWQNLSSSYLSLDPLYGVDQTEQDKVRDYSENNLGKGLLYPDTFASSRLLLMPPASCALLVLFCRNHNRVAEQVLQLNEAKRWNPNPSEITSKERKKRQDDEVFGTARLVNCNYFVQMILHDYLQSILGSVQADSDWSLDPRTEIKTLLGKTPKATGNSVSIEFNILYRWHSCLSMRQTQWLEEKISKGLPSRKWDDLNEGAFMRAMQSLMEELNAGSGTDPRQWKLSRYEVNPAPTGGAETVEQGTYERDPETGKFRDEDLARILRDATYDVAGAFGAHHTPAVLRWVDCQGMRTARDVWRASTLNEFREFLGLKAYETFKEWNSDETVANAMEDLVGHPSNIPLHVGLHGEECKTPRLGAGLCPGYTISRAILSDAVALVRGDRFYTDSATADALTDWGLNDCQPDPREGSYGGMLQKLIINHLPNQYAYNDVALLFPFMVPQTMHQVLLDISPQKALNYSLNPEPYRPIGFEVVQDSHDRKLVCKISDTEQIQRQRMEELFGIPSMRSCSSNVYEAVDSVIKGEEWKLFEKFLSERIKQCSTRRSPINCDQTVDICRDVVNPMISGWLAHIFGLVETGLHSQQLLLTALSDIYLYLTEAQMTYKSRSAARVAACGLAWQLKFHIVAESSPKSLRSMIKKGAAVVTVGALNMLEDTIKFVSGQPIMKHVHEDSRRFYHSLREINATEENLSADELAADCLRAVATLAYTMTHGAAHSMDHLIPPAESSTGSHLDSTAFQGLRDLRSLGIEDPNSFENAEVREKYCRYGLESTRLNHWEPALKGLVANLGPDSKGTNQVGTLDFEYDPARKIDEYQKLLDLEGHCSGFYQEVIPVVIKEVLKLKQVRKAPGRQGHLSKIRILDSISGMPTMHIRYDGTANFLNVHNRP
ncbi:hypothetical protein Pst134EA_022959 [Puccinia striiformis f. sp. tritici]|uniref:Heme peroxidase n=2 Tax=Puccinia striiformis f. sp. tritici TaxID=168172 RepID=A0A0L0V6I1_9BASI|nr:hypothetical protein Pst134EA_022959 [Puccinia striiformis f. sp. tritici]KAH9455497.1 hypothetical protein Pst134EA_022959 [Puccinia striiformis f. sp. tritici]KNE94589.1 hypothetical protein PSTG_12053 [Puccinia striiformis f. sp. tritici PST-78]